MMGRTMTLRRRHLLFRLAATLLMTILIAACGGGGGGDNSSGPVAGTPPADERAEAARLLRQASFGPTTAAIDEVVQLGIPAWVDQQLATPATYQLPILQRIGTPNDQSGQADRIEAWFESVLTGPDQLRQRVAFALSEIFVVSEQSGLFNQPYGLAYYYDILLRNAFGNFRTLMEEVTLSPAMGVYLSMLGNQRPNPALNIRPDENYARELMQLFTIGLVQLNPDGSVQRDGLGQPIPTYDQDIVEGFAHVYTGWTFGGSAAFFLPSFDYQRPMQAFPAFHDTGAKQLLNGVTLPAGQTPAQDLAAALDNIFSHPNVGPFIARQLIQRLTASNPSPAYIQRVAAVFDDNGLAVRGDLAAVVRAILLDPEARAPVDSDADGKLVEPLLRLTALWRAFDARAANGRYQFPFADFFTQQAPLRARSVFNFFTPNYAPPGEIRQRGLVAPEMQIVDELYSALNYELFTLLIVIWNSANTTLDPDQIAIDISDSVAVAGDLDALLDHLDDKLFGGGMSATLRGEARAMAALHTDPNARVVEALLLITSAPEFGVVQ